MKAFLAIFLLALPAAADWPMWGGDTSRNMVSPGKGIPAAFDPGKFKGETEEIEPSKDLRWVVKLGSQTYGNPVVAGGRVFVGTNNAVPRDPRIKGDRGILLALDEATGAFLWQLAVPKLGSGKINDWENLGVTASPTIDGNRLYVVSNRNEVLCLDVAGQANGNDGPFKDEGQYLAGAGNAPLELTAHDADIVWRFDMREELGVFPHNATSSSVLVVGDRLYVSTSNGVDWGHTNLPSPNAPAFIALDKNTGTLLGEEASGISARTLHSNWGSPTLAKAGELAEIIFGGGDGNLFAFDPAPKEDAEGLAILRELWRYDAVPPLFRRDKAGVPVKYATPKGPSEIIATPVFSGGKLYTSIGQDPEHGLGFGRVSAVTPDGKAVWTFDDVGRSLSTPAVTQGLVFTADFEGRVYCLDAATGKLKWKHDTRAHIWGSPLAVDGKVFVGNEDGDWFAFALSPKKQLIATTRLPAPMLSTAVATNGTLYLATQTHLYAVKGASK